MSWHRLPARTPRSGAECWSTGNAVDKIGINDYHYITKFKDEDATNTTRNLLGLTSPLIFHTLSAAGRSWQEEVKQDGIKLIRTCESPPPISTLDQASDESKSIYKEQFGTTRRQPRYGHSITGNQWTGLASTTTATSPSSRTWMPSTLLAICWA